LLLCANAAQADGIDCDLASNAAEEAICADPVLQRMDGELAAAWTRARADRDTADALTADQQRWLRERDACGADLGCLRPAYARRLSELGGSAGAPFRWPGTWTRVGGNGDEASLKIAAVVGHRYRLAFDASAGANTGNLEGETTAGTDTLVLQHLPGAPGCRLSLHRNGRLIDIEQNQDDCGAGAGVSFAGRYVPGAEGRVAVTWTLLNLGIVKQEADDARLRALLGAKDYAAFVATANTIQPGRDLDGLGADVVETAVRGLFTLQEGLLMRAEDGRLWVGLLDFDAAGQPQLRYYASDPAWAARLPKTLDAWRQRFAATPVRLMSAPGQPPYVAGAHD
jgi:uncharacterized protein